MVDEHKSRANEEGDVDASTPVAESVSASPPEKERGMSDAPPVQEATQGDASEKDAVEKPARKPGRRGKGKGSKNIPSGIAHIKSTFNNTIVSITDLKGNIVSWNSAGRSGFKGSRKSTAYAATIVSQEAARGAMGHGMREVEVRVQGPGAGRESAIRALQSAGLTINAIKDVTPMPHNGCRPPKRRRV